MFKKLQNKTKKALTKVGALFEVLGEIIEEVMDADCN